MKLIRGDAGKPDGWIPPKDVLGLEDDDDIRRLQNILYHNSVADGCDVDGISAATSGTRVRLFNLTADPTERTNLAAERPEEVRELLSRLARLESTMIPPDVARERDRGNPSHFGGVFQTGWCRAEPRRKKAKKGREDQEKEDEDLTDLIDIDIV